MAKTPSEWYDLLVVEKNTAVELQTLQPNVDTAQDLLQDVTTTSKVAKWRLWIWVFAVAAWMFETVHEKYLALTTAAASRQYGTATWWAKVAKEFQIGDPLVWLTAEQRYGYVTIDATKQIVQKVAVIEANRQVRIKVANYVGGVITPLTVPQLLAFDAYVNDLAPAGISTATISRTADLLKLYLKVYYDPLQIKANGESLSQPGIFPVQVAITNYLTTLEFGGVLVLTKLIDAIQAVDGVVNPIITSASARFGAIPYSPIVESYLADAGYMVIDSAFPLSTTITYVASV